MKKLLIVFILGVIAYSPIKAQEFKPFKFELGVLYGIPTDDAFKGGVGFYLHPSYYLNDQLNVGLKAEWAVIGAADEMGTSVSISAIGSYLATANYYFSTSKVRPYAGLGVGLYSLGSVSSDLGAGNSIDVDYGTKFGVAPKVGLDLGHFTLNVAYNMIFGVDSDLAGKNYMSVGIGAFFGGGKN